MYIMQDCQMLHVPHRMMDVTRSEVSESYWTEQDLEELRTKIGSVKRKGFVRLGERKMRP
jgi:hypothetical protein